MEHRLSWNSQFFCLNLLNAGVAGLPLCAQPSLVCVTCVSALSSPTPWRDSLLHPPQTFQTLSFPPTPSFCDLLVPIPQCILHGPLNPQSKERKLGHEDLLRLFLLRVGLAAPCGGSGPQCYGPYFFLPCRPLRITIWNKSPE